MSLPGDALERGRHLGIQPVVAANTGDVLIDGCTIVHRPARHEHPRPVVSKRAGDPAANAEGPARDDGDSAFQSFHGRTYSEHKANCQERVTNASRAADPHAVG